MDKYEHLITYGGRKVHAYIPKDLAFKDKTLCNLNIAFGDKPTDQPVTCKRCLKAIEERLPEVEAT